MVRAPLRVRLLTLFLAVLSRAAPAAAASDGPRFHAVVEVGARGARGYLFTFDAGGEGLAEAKVLHKAEVPAPLAAAGDGLVPSAAIRASAAAAARVVVELRGAAAGARLGAVPFDLLGASGLAAFANRDALKKDVDRETGLSLELLDAGREARALFLAAVPRSRRGSGASFDLGSGVGRLACLEAGRPEVHDLGYGAVSLRKAAETRGGGFESALDALLAEKVRPAITGCIAGRARLYLTGGVGWAVAAYTHPERALSGHVAIRRGDLERFERSVADGSWKDGEPRLAFPSDVPSDRQAAITAAARADRQRVAELYKREDLLAGLALLRAVLDGRRQPPAIFFVRNANPLFGHVLEKYREDEGAPPAGPAYFAGVDLGSRGAKAFLYGFVQEPEGVDARILFRDDVNTRLVSEAVGDRFSAKGISEAAAAVARLVGEMQAFAEEDQLDVEVYVVASSAVFGFANRDELKRAVDAAAGVDLAFVDARTEAYDAFLSSVPTQDRPEAVAVDIGGATTKLGCVAGGAFSPAELPWGAITLRKAVPPGKDFHAGLQPVLAKVAAAYKQERMNTPCLGARPRTYVVGGTAWAMVTYMRPEASQLGYVVITRRDVDGFLKKLQDGSWNRGEPRFAFERTVTPEQQAAIRAANAADREKVQNVYAREDLIAGASLLRVILEGSSPDARIYFVRNGNYVFGWALDRFKGARIGAGGR